MLALMTAALTIVLLTLTVMQAVYVVRYCQILDGSHEGAATSACSESNKSPLTESASQNDAPAAIVLCMRGVDPTLEHCLTGITNQVHTNYQIHIVFDHQADPAVEFVESFFAGAHKQPVIHFNLDPLETCSLKCSGLMTVFNNLPAEIEHVALIDADAVADEHWLTDLLAPFDDPTVGATTGNRWFSPEQPDLGSTYRKVWNAAAIVQAVLYNIGWGGSLAFRKSAIDQSGLSKRLVTAFCEDTLATDALQGCGLKLHRVPNLIMVNTESTSLSDAFNWIARQVLTVRIHHNRWPLVLLHGLLTGVITFFVPVLFFMTLLRGDTTSAITLFSVFALYQIGNIAQLKIIERANLRAIDSRDRHQMNSTSTDQNPFLLVVSTLLNQILFPIAIVKTWRMRSVRWRGIEYQIDSAGRLMMKQFIPYRDLVAQKPASQNATASIQ